jgi:hypothetical protein
MKLVGADIYIWSEKMPDVPKEISPFSLLLISNRGTKIYPPPAPELEFNDWWRCRYRAQKEVSHADIQRLLDAVSQKNVWTKVQKLFEINGVNAYSEPY